MLSVNGNSREGIPGDLDVDGTVRDLVRMQLRNGGSLSQEMSVLTAGSLMIDGDLRDCLIRVNIFDIDEPVTGLDSLTVHGEMVNSFIRTRGSLGRLVIGRMVNSAVVAGAPSLDANGFPPGAENVLAISNIDSIRITNDPSQHNFINSFIIAGDLGSVAITEPETFNGPGEFGISYTTLSGKITLLIGGDLIELRESDGSFASDDFQVRSFHQAPVIP